MSSPNVAPAVNTVDAIRTKIRRLTASPSEVSLPTSTIDFYINTYYNNDFPYAIKMDQMRSVYTFFTEPYRDRYPIDVNYNQGLRSPCYVEGIIANFFKDRGQFYALWPRFPTKFQPIAGDGTTTNFQFTIPAPFLSKEVVLGGLDNTGAPISVNDDGNGNLQLQIPNPVVTVPPYTAVYTSANAPTTDLIGKPIPGMHNQNTLNPGLNNTSTITVNPNTSTNFPNGIGTVNYVTGQFNITFPVAPAAGMNMTLWVSQYQTGRPYNILFWNNELTIRPVPKLIHKVEIEAYLTPVQFMLNTDQPILNQWWQLISIGSAIKILEDRQDMEGVENLALLYDRQAGLALERQGVEELFQPNYTLFNSPLTWGASFYGPWGNTGSF